MKLSLGTVQFGVAYGVANQQGRVSFETAEAIVREAERRGLRMLDTAIGYGDSEARLGQIGVDDWQIVTKLPACPETCVDVQAWVDRELRGALRRLARERVHGVLLHRPAQLLEAGGPALFAALASAKANGLVKKIGVSVYAPAELDTLMSQFDLDIVQLPANVFDDRFAKSGWLGRLAARGVEVHSRSAFLQGLLLMTPSTRPAWTTRWSDLWREYDDWVSDVQLTRAQACLRSALSVPGFDHVLVGVDSVDQLRELVAAADGPAPPAFSSASAIDPDLLNPSRWPST